MPPKQSQITNTFFPGIMASHPGCSRCMRMEFCPHSNKDADPHFTFRKNAAPEDFRRCQSCKCTVMGLQQTACRRCGFNDYKAYPRTWFEWVNGGSDDPAWHTRQAHHERCEVAKAAALANAVFEWVNGGSDDPAWHTRQAHHERCEVAKAAALANAVARRRRK
jgi:hypothetical protein